MKISKTLILSCLFLMTGCSVPNNVNLQKDINNVNVEKNVSNIYHTQNDNLPATNNEVESKTVLADYGLSVGFMKDLKAMVADKVLNKTEIKLLEEKATSNSEKNFINIIKKKNSFTMSNLTEKNTDAETLDFIINKDFDIDGNFLKSLNKNNISTMSGNSDSEEKKYLNSLAKYDSANILTLDQNENIKEIVLNSSYDESAVIPGNTIPEIIGNIGQGDKLESTSTDNFRCGAAVIINAVLSIKGINGFNNLNEKMNLNFAKLTYENVHLAQDKLMNTVNSPSSGLSISYTTNGDSLNGAFINALKFAGLKWEDTLVQKTDNSYRANVEKFFTENPKSVLVASAYLDTGTGNVNFKGTANHYVLITKQNGKLYMSNSGNKNGTGSNNLELTNLELNNLYLSNNFLIKVSA